MVKKSLALLAVTLAAFSITVPEANAKPPYDLDYQVQVGTNAYRYEVWIQPQNGPAYLDSSHHSMYDATWRQFKLYEWNLLSPGATSWIATVQYVKYENWLSPFETYQEAADAAADWEALGFPTKIVAVFGGYLPPTNDSPWSSAATGNYGFMLQMALILDDENDEEEDNQIMAASTRDSSYSVMRRPR